MSKYTPLTPAQRSLRARMGAHALHAKVDSREHTAAARKGLWAKFEREVDPEFRLDPAERQRRAKHKQSEHMSRLALASARKRSARSGGRA